MITTEETDTEMREMTTKDETETDPIPTKIAKRNTMTTLEKVGTETSDMMVERLFMILCGELIFF